MEHLRPARRAVDEIDDVVEACREEVNVFPVERRHKAPVDPVHDRVGDLVGLVLDRLDLPRELLEPGRLGEQFIEQGGRPRHARREPVEQLEKPFVFWNQPHGSGASGAGSAVCGGAESYGAANGGRKRPPPLSGRANQRTSTTPARNPPTCAQKATPPAIS